MYGVETSICFDWYQGRQRAADRLAELRGFDKNGAFYPCPLNMSIAWTYRPPSVHFLAEFGHIYGRGRSRQAVPLLGD